MPQKTVQEMKDGVVQLLSNAHLYLEFNCTFMPDISIQDQAKVCLFAIGMMPRDKIEVYNNIQTNNHPIWYNACIAPMFFIENIDFEIGGFYKDSEMKWFKCRLKNSYILANADFK